MELHWDKFQLLAVRCSPTLRTPDGTNLVAKPSMLYLGATLASDGNLAPELGRRIGAAKADFTALSRVWRHSSLPWQHKLRIYVALIESKLLYGLACACFSAADNRRLDGVQNRFLRSILGIKAAFFSRISNAEVLRRSGHIRASVLLLRRQCYLYGKIVRTAEHNPLRRVSFIPGSTRPHTERYIRRVGRPRREWIPAVQQELRRHAPASTPQFTDDCCKDAKKWREFIEQHI